MFLRLAATSLWHRKGSVALTTFAIFISVLVMLGLEHLRQQAKQSFGKTVSGVDLIVGAPAGDINLLLYTVFRIGNPSKNIRWSSYQMLADTRGIRWAVPISLGDSHQGYRVLGTNSSYFKHFNYGNKQALAFSRGRPFEAVYDVVLGAEVAARLGYTLGDKLILAHGLGATSFSQHDGKPFTVTGILAATGTPVDQTLHVSLQGLEAVHASQALTAASAKALQPQSITAAFVGLQSKMAIFTIQRKLNQYKGEPLQAVLPGVALSQLWKMLGVVENTLRLIAVAVFIAALLGLAAMLLISIRERQREIAILRALGAPPLFVFLLIQAEALLIASAAAVMALATLWAVLNGLQSTLASDYGLYLSAGILSKEALIMLGLVLAGSSIIALIPGLTAYSRMLRQQL